MTTPASDGIVMAHLRGGEGEGVEGVGRYGPTSTHVNVHAPHAHACACAGAGIFCLACLHVCMQVSACMPARMSARMYVCVSVGCGRTAARRRSRRP